MAPGDESIPEPPAALQPLRRRRPPRRFSFRARGIPQSLRLGGTLLGISLGASLGAVGDRLRPREQREARREERTHRLATRLARTLGELKGPFAKAGQFAASRPDLLPAPALAALAGLRDRVPPLPLSDLEGLLEAELGAPVGERFARFDPTPLGAASLAQAHRAELADGTEVVVKVQYPWLAESLAADLAVLRRGLALARRNRAGARRAFDEFAAALAEELDFEREARIAAEIASNLAGDDRILVPRILASHSSRRVLTMTWHPAVALSDGAGLAALGAAPREILEILVRAYAQQIFVDGLFHADPHPGNLFVLDEPDASRRPRVLFVDFGLSRRLSEELRRELRLGFYALLKGDREGFVDGMERMGMISEGGREGVEEAVGKMLGKLRSAPGGALGLGRDRVLALKDEAKALVFETSGLELPNDLLLYARTLSYLFSLGREIDPEVDLMKLSVPYLLRFLGSRD